MEINIDIDNALYERALEVADPAMSPTDLWQEVMHTFIRIQSAKLEAATDSSTSSRKDRKPLA